MSRSVDPLGDLDVVPWHALHGTHGPATDIPSHVRALRSPIAAARVDAQARLSDAIHHQGTRWQVSAVVIPFLVALIDDPHTQERASLAELLDAVALGDRDDGALPFEPHRVFAAARGLTEDQLDTVIQLLYYSDDASADDVSTDLVDLAAVRWDADAYLSAARHLTAYCRWLADPDVRVAAHAGALLAWFHPTDDVIATLLTVPADAERASARASANLALAYLARTDTRATAALRELVTSAESAISVTAATALAYRLGDTLPDAALDILIHAKDSAHLPETPPGWDRSMRGFVALALHHIGLR